MDIQVYFKEKMSKVLFIEVNLDALNKLFKTDIKETIFLPILSSVIIEEIKNSNSFNNIDIKELIEGMLCVLGCDEKFRFNNIYMEILKKNNHRFHKIIKGRIYEKIKLNDQIDAFILLKGFSYVENSKEVYEKLLWLADSLRATNPSFKREERKLIEEAKKLSYNVAYYYETLLLIHEGDYDKAHISINEYTNYGGQVNHEILSLKKEIKNLRDYKKGRELVYDSPIEALQILLPLIDEFGEDAVLFYYIAVAYRVNGNYEKAIYYLNEAVLIDKELVDVVNELGLNYACLGAFNEAVKYFVRAFEVSNAVEICTNIIMCYININNKDKARQYLELAKKINPEDELIKDIEAKL
jgi:tetratricopeptide (TPR) repeat protein